MKFEYHQTKPGKLNKETLASLKPSTIIYLSGYDPWFRWDRDPAVNSSTTKTVSEHAKDEGSLLSKSPDIIFDELMELDGVGIKTGLVLTLALTGSIPDLTALLVKTLLANIYSGCDDSLTQGNHQGSVWQRYGLNEGSTIQPMGAVRQFCNQNYNAIIDEICVQPRYAPRIEDIARAIKSEIVMLDDNLSTTKELLALESWYNGLLTETVDTAYPVNTIKAWIDDYADYLDDDQKKAMISYLSSNKKLSLMVGIAGSGKSAVIQAIDKFIETNTGDHPLITSYMNKAVSNLRERIPDYTFGGSIMRGFCSLAMKSKFAKPDSIFSEALVMGKWVIIDESSVISSRHLMYIKTLIDNMHPESKILMVGDPEQLHPVKEHGYPFIRACELQAPLMLTGFHRSSGKDIKRIADMVRYDRKLDVGGDSVETVVYNGSMSDAGSKIIEYYNKATSVCEFGVITPTNSLKTDINLSCFRALAPSKIVINHKDNQKIPVLWEGAKLCVDIPITDKTIQLVKNQIIRIKSVGTLKSTITTESNLEYKLLNRDIETSCSIAFAMTIHKYQGSELDTCFMMTRRECGSYLHFHRQSNLIYVAVTRARNKLIIHELTETPNKPHIDYTLVDPPKRIMSF